MKKNKIPTGVIYTVTNKESGQVYVGVTTTSIGERKNDHLQKANKGTGHFFQNALATLGPEAFEWKQVDTASSVDELARKEKEYIKKYNSVEDGFNSDSGGGIRKSIYQYSLEEGSLVNQFKCLEDAASAVSANKSSISNACLNVNNVYKGYYWSYDFSDPYIPEIDKRRKEVLQMDINGNILAKYNSVAEASRQTGTSKSPIAKTCRGEQEQSGGYFWKYSD